MKKNDDIREVINSNIITFYYISFLDIFVFVSILTISKNIDTYRYLLTIFPSLPPTSDHFDMLFIITPTCLPPHQKTPELCILNLILSSIIL